MPNLKLLREFAPLCPDGVCDISVLNESEKRLKNDGYYILTGILQSANKKNGNSRIYRRSILEREIENYQKAINESRAIGECVERGSEILTIDGWKDFKDLNEYEYIYTLNKENNKIEIQRITEKIDYHHEGEVFKFEGRNIDIKVTPGHKFLLVNRYGKKITVTAQEIYDNRKKFNKCYIPKLGDWSLPEKDNDFFVLPGFTEFDKRCKKELIEKYSKPLKIDKKVWCQFMGIYLSEGSAPKNHGYYIQITQNEGSVAKKIRHMLSQFPEEIKWKEAATKKENGSIKVDFYVNDARLFSYLSKLGKSYQKYIPKELKLFSVPYLEEILEWFLMGDGRERVVGKNRKAKEVFSTSKRLIDDLNEILIKSGSSGNITKREPYDRLIEGRVIKKENQRILYFLHFSTTKGIYLDDRFLKIEKEKYSDKVYCVRVLNNTFYCRKNGKSFWSHNCDHPEDSVVNLKNASHMVLRTWWKGSDVWGTIKVLKHTPAGQTLEGLIKDGVQLGVSSRGLGSLQESPQGAIVQEDFQLICFDMVSEPSTPNAYMIPENKTRQYFTKADRINRMLNEIVRKK